MNRERERIGFIGLGIMGKQMATNLLRRGYSVIVYNRSKKRPISDILSLGAGTAATPRELAKVSDIVIDMVTDAPDVDEVLLGESGVLHGGRKGLIVIDMSTNSPEVARSISSRLREKGIEFLDAPVSGGDKGAKEATLTIMVGGRKKTFERCKPILESMGKEVVYMGASGAGQATKLCNQIAVSIHMLATSEALLFGSSLKLDLKALLRVLTSGAAGSWSLANLGPKIIQRDFEPGFKAAHLSKDLRYVMQLSERERLTLPGSSTVYQLINSILAEGKGESGTQVLARALEKLSSREIV